MSKDTYPHPGRVQSVPEMYRGMRSTRSSSSRLSHGGNHHDRTHLIGDDHSLDRLHAIFEEALNISHTMQALIQPTNCVTTTTGRPPSDGEEVVYVSENQLLGQVQVRTNGNTACVVDDDVDDDNSNNGNDDDDDDDDDDDSDSSECTENGRYDTIEPFLGELQDGTKPRKQ